VPDHRRRGYRFKGHYPPRGYRRHDMKRKAGFGHRRHGHGRWRKDVPPPGARSRGYRRKNW
jgi:hypothetical protein